MRFFPLSSIAALLALCEPGLAYAQVADEPAAVSELTFLPTERAAWLEALPDGEQFLMTDIDIANPTDHPVEVPAIRIQLRNKVGALVYQAELAPPAAVLVPGQTMKVTQAIGPVPETAARLEFGWRPVSPAD